MRKTFLQQQKADPKKINLIVPNVRLTQKPVGRYLNINGVYQADIMQFEKHDKGYIYALCFVSTTTGQGQAYPLMFKDADDVIKETKKFLKNHKEISHLETDNGGEFTNAKFRELMEHHKIIHKTSYVGKSTQTSMIDNFIYQLRTLINSTLNTSQKKSWVNVLRDAVKAVNDHRKSHYRFRKASLAFKLPVLPIKKEMLNIGDNVHVAKYKFHDTMRLRAGNERFSEDVRKVENITLNNGQTVKYRVSGISKALFDRRDLQKL
jgi:hypothetical protein